MNLFTPSNLDDAMRNDFGIFARKCVDTLNGPGAYQHNGHIEVVARRLQEIATGENTRLILNLPPRHLKSVLAAVALPAWVLGRDPSQTVMCVSYGQALSSKHGRDFQRIIDARWYRELFPKFAVLKNTEDVLETTLRGGSHRRIVRRPRDWARR